MTGGLSYDIHTESIRLCPDRSTLGIVNAFTKDPLKFDPGTHYFYSLCHDVLGAVIEVVSGMKLSEYMKVKLFDPLGIKDMGFRPNPEQRARLAPMYTYLNGEGKSTRMPRPVCIFTLSEEYDSGGAGLFGTAEEYSKIISAISLGGTAKNGYRVLKKETALEAVSRGSDKVVGGWFHFLGKWVYCPLCLVALIAGAILGGIG